MSDTTPLHVHTENVGSSSWSVVLTLGDNVPEKLAELLSLDDRVRESLAIILRAMGRIELSPDEASALADELTDASTYPGVCAGGCGRVAVHPPRCDDSEECARLRLNAKTAMSGQSGGCALPQDPHGLGVNR